MTTYTRKILYTVKKSIPMFDNQREEMVSSTVDIATKPSLRFVVVLSYREPETKLGERFFWHSGSAARWFERCHRRWRPTTGRSNNSGTAWDISDISTVTIHFRLRPTRWSYLQHCLMSADIQMTTGNSNDGLQTGNSYNLGMVRDSNEISTATPTFATMLDLLEVLPTLSDDFRQQ